MSDWESITWFDREDFEAGHAPPASTDLPGTGSNPSINYTASIYVYAENNLQITTEAGEFMEVDWHA